MRISEWFASADVLYSGDWIELQNTNANPVLLTGLRLTDNRAGDASAYTFPALSYIAGSGYTRLLADGSTAPGHLPFSLDAEYETLSLLGAGDALLDTVAFYPQTTDYSMGRDALGNIVFYELPTRGLLNGAGDPAYANALAMLRGLRITEIMFNAIGGSDYDYVELRNVGASAFDLAGVTFVQGIAFTFPAQILAPGQSIIVVKSLTKFRARYGTGPLVAGTYTGQLDNGGETVAIQLPAPFDANVLTFGYSDGWQPSTDGLGKSLVVLNPLVRAGVWGDKDTWSASLGNGGDPDGTGPLSTTYSGWSALHAIFSVIEDRDKDGVHAFTEFGFGESDPDTESSGILPGVAVTPTGHAMLQLDLPVNAAAAQSHGMAETVYEVQASDDLLTWTTIATKSPAAAWSGTATVTIGAAVGGFVPVNVEDMIAAPGQLKRFLRVQLNWVP